MGIGLSNSISKSSTETSEKLGCFSLYRIFKQTLVGSQKSISISSDRNIRVPPEVVHSFRSEYYRSKFAVPFLTIWFIVLLFFTCVENSKKNKIKMVRAIRLGWPGLIGKCRSIFFGYSLHWSPTGRLRIMKALKISLSQSDRSICTRPLDSTILPKPIKKRKTFTISQTRFPYRGRLN